MDEHDLFCLTISLGNTVGDQADLKGLLPVLLERTVTSTELDPGIVLGKLPHEQWRAWPVVEQDAIDRYLDAVWRSLLARYPSQTGSFRDAVTFLESALATGEGVDRFLATWDATFGAAADRHLAETVNMLDHCVLGYGATRQTFAIMPAWVAERTRTRTTGRPSSTYVDVRCLPRGPPRRLPQARE